MLFRLFLIFVLLFVLFATYVRLAPVNPDDWHIDPTAADASAGAKLELESSPIWTETPEQVLSVLDMIATGTDRTSRLAGDVSSGRTTYVTRSLVMGFADFTTVAAEQTPDGTRLTILARQRFGIEDLGVNQARVDAWLAALSQDLPPQ